MKVVVHVDGGARGNPGPAAAAAVVSAPVGEVLDEAAVTLGTALAAIVTRITRSSVLEVMRQDYVMTARAKGLSERVVVWRHILRNALITVITVLGLQLGALLNGSVITETVFSYPGIGDLLIQSISVRDYRLTQVLILFFGIIYFVVNLLVDVLYTLVDPRIKL